MPELDRNEWRSFLDGAMFPLAPAPRRQDGEVDEEALQGYAEWMSRRGAAGVVVGSETARTHLLTGEQQFALIARWRERLSPNQAVVAVVTAAPDASAPEAEQPRRFRDAVVKRARRLLKAGADVLWPAAPVVCHGRDNETALVVDYYEKLAKLGAPLFATGCGLTGRPTDYSPELFERLAELDNVVAIQVGGCGDLLHQQRLCAALTAALPDLPLLTTEERCLSYALMLGAKAALVALGAVCTDLVAELVKTHADRRFHRFHALAPKVEALSRVLYAPPPSAVVQRLLWVLELTEVIAPEAAFDPAAPELPADAKESLRQALEDIGQVAPPPKPSRTEEEELDEFLARQTGAKPEAAP